MLVIDAKFTCAALVVVSLFLTACAPVETKDEFFPKAEIVEKKVSEPIVVKQETPKEKQDVVILLSSEASSYHQLADAISSKLKQPARIKVLPGLPASDNRILSDLKSMSDVTHVVALGAKAAKAIRKHDDRRRIFAQIVNYESADLVSDSMKGVSALPSPEKLFKDWKALSPSLSSVAVVVGKNLDTYLRRVKKAAAKHNIELIVEQVNTDKEFIYKSKNIHPNIEGQWVLPDNRVLSAKSLKEVMSYASRRGRQVVVFSPKLLSFGGFLYVASDFDSVAKAVVQRLNDSADKTTVPGNGILPVMNHTMGINRNIAKQLNLDIPQEYQAYVDGE